MPVLVFFLVLAATVCSHFGDPAVIRRDDFEYDYR